MQLKLNISTVNILACQIILQQIIINTSKIKNTENQIDTETMPLKTIGMATI